MRRVTALAIFASVLCITATPLAQDRLRGMPGYDQFQKMQQAAQQNRIVSGAVSQIQWGADGLAVSYMLAGRRQQFDLKTMSVSAEPTAPPAAAGPAPGRGASTPPPAAAAGAGRSGGMEQSQTEMAEGRFSGCPSGAAARGRQQDCIVSPDGKLKAFYRARNLWIASFDGSGEKQVTTDGSEKARIKNGTASWVYGEELSQTTAIWWSPDSRRVGFYRFDESKVQDFYVQMNQTSVQDTIDVEAYPKAGTANPVADVLVYDVAGGKSTTIDIRDGKPFDNSVVGHYVYAVQWSKDGTELLMNRTNRRQQILEFVACQPSTGKCRVVLREEWLTGWINTDPAARRRCRAGSATASASSGSRSATAGRTSTSTT